MRWYSLDMGFAFGFLMVELVFWIAVIAGCVALIIHFLNKQRRRDELQRQQTWYTEQLWRQQQGLPPVPYQYPTTTPPPVPGIRQPGERWSDDPQARPYM